MDPRTKNTSSVDNGIALGYVSFSYNGPPTAYSQQELQEQLDQQVEAFRDNALKHHYFTPLKHQEGEELGATEYANMAAYQTRDPKLLRVFLPQGGRVQLESDPDSISRNREVKAVRTSSKVPAGSVLRSKHARVKVTQASEDFKNEYNKVPFRPMFRLPELDSTRAAHILADVQSDSDDDKF
ncbi:hypothetical protein GJA_1678 [Janthinobacterium agaricidamnosum NBRC 102515 = DSM 9628]|uniref:Uncharacterized protein n=2 Tax=Janthinobacterium agaricidamnosum TaxID=55508 RepID=W0V367_9BURK|nr:hypothetical protein GJA_1678 [Janthinobacterium agaricidamnosum NBRC 102515 = DSM 9628]